tara:strand:- start:363 stop:1796 length:1434 start_codon:yes stop_codon:yes gene_type:complete
MTEYCSICCDKFNKSINTKITCPVSTCQLDACKKCVRTYILNTTHDPHCMMCKMPYDDDFIFEHLNKTFLNTTYKIHRKENLFQREKSKMPETMQLAENESLARKQEKTAVEILAEITKLKKLLDTKERERNICITNASNYRKNKINDDERRKFIMPCANNDCKGFLSSSYKCVLCNYYTCNKCHVFIGDNDNQHICNEDDIKSAELIKSSTKPCPGEGCGERIQKIDGCPQMWCPSCKTAFNWDTLKIDNGPIHNPEYFRWLQQNANQPIERAPGDVVCGGVPNNLIYTINNREFQLWINTQQTSIPNLNYKNTYEYLKRIIRVISHITYYELRKYQDQRDELLDTSKYRIKYLLEDYDDDLLKDMIYKNDLKIKRNAKFCNIYELLSQLGIDLLRFVEDKVSDFTNKIRSGTFDNEWKDIHIKLLDFENVFKYFNKFMYKISYYNNITVTKYTSNVDKGILLAKQKKWNTGWNKE